MTSYIGCFGVLGITVFIALLFLRRKKIENEMTDFYQAHSLYTTKDEPPNVRESLSAGNDNLYCCLANLTTKTGERIEFCWWEWYLKSTTTINGAPSASFTQYLAVSFAPNSVSDEFIETAVHWADKSEDDFAQKAKDFFVNNSDTPYRAEILADGSLIICWRTVTKRRDVYEAKIEWLKNNLSAPVALEIFTPETIQNADTTEPKTAENVAPLESKTAEAAAPIQPQFIEPAPRDESGIMRVDFYRHDNYATLERRLKSGWANLSLELNHASAKFQHEGWDIMDAEDTFGDLTKPNEIAFALDDETTAGEASRLFSEFSGGTAYVVRDQYPVESPETLAYCNNPFRLPLDEFTYGEFKRRFSERWTNLSVELYKNPPHIVGAPHGSGELAEDFEMKNLKHADKAFLHDYIFISTWSDKLVYIRIAAAIKNNRFGIYSEKNYRRMMLKEFNEAESAEWLREKSIR